MKKYISFIMLPFFFFCACIIDGNQAGAQDYKFTPLTAQEIRAMIDKVKAITPEPVEKDEIAILETTLGTIEFKFYPEKAPNHCANFKKLANAEFYDGTTFHRVIPGFMIQGGSILSKDNIPGNDGGGSPGYQINAEFNNISHEKGIVSMARSQNPNSAGSQFFICAAKADWLDGQYTVFGKVTKGLNVVDKIVNVKRDSRDRPLKDVRIMKARVVKK